MKKLFTFFFALGFLLISAGLFAQSGIPPGDLEDLEAQDNDQTVYVPATEKSTIATLVPDGTKAMMAMPAPSSTYGPRIRGYWFTAPCNFTITGLRVPDDNISGDQSIEIVRFNTGPPPFYSSTTNDFVSLGRWIGVAGSGIIPCNIPVTNGDILGIYGCRGTTTSYGNGPYNTTIDGNAVTLVRSGMQFELPPAPMHDIWQSASGSIGRIEMYYEVFYATVWTGVIDSDWNTAGNWNLLAVPDASADVSIPSGCLNYPTLTAAGVCHDIYIESNAAGTATLLDNGLLTVGGTATVERYYSAVISNVPEYIYYTMENNVGMTTPNTASAPVGTNPAPLTGTTAFATGGQWGSTCIQGDGAYNGGVNTGWNFDLGAGAWTISMYLDIPSNTTGSAHYIFGDPGAGSFRCFHNGVAGQDNIVLRGPFSQVNVNGIGPAPTVVHFVYDPAVPEIRAYKNGVFDNAVAQSALNIPTGSGFKVGGYSSSRTIIGKVDEFRLYTRVLSNTEIDATWDVPLGVAGPAWHLVGTPISDGLSGIYLGQYLQSYNEATAAWTDIIPDNIPLVPLQGYGFWPNGGNTAYYAGTLNTGSVSFPLTAANPYGWNLLGNPYPSSIDWDIVTKPAYINGAVYYLDAVSGNYVSYNGGMGGGSQYIPPEQGFFVSATGPGPFQVDNSVRTHTNGSSFYKSELTYMAEIQAIGNGYSDVTHIRFDEDATSGFDGQYDAYKLFSLEYNNRLPQIYTIGGDKLSINVLPATNVVPLLFRSGVEGSFTISIGEIKDIDYLFLEDLETGVMTNLLEENYTFSYKTGNKDDRFNLHFALYEDVINAVNIYSYGKDIYVLLPENVTAEIYVYNLMGQLIKTAVSEGSRNTIKINNGGNYLVKVMTLDGVKAQKVFVK